jgi:hypothetical protein
MNSIFKIIANFIAHFLEYQLYCPAAFVPHLTFKTIFNLRYEYVVLQIFYLRKEPKIYE